MAFPTNMATVFGTPGIMSSFLAVDIGIASVLIFVLIKAIVPFAVQFKIAKALDALAGSTDRHWLYGHTKQFPPSEKGLLKAVNTMTKYHPTMFNRWFAPFSSGLHLYHPDTVVSFFHSGAPKDNVTYRFMRPWVGDGLLTSKGRKWRRNRHLLTPAFHFSILKGYTQIMNETAQKLLDKWGNTLNASVEMSSDVSLMTLDTMLRCAMSSETNCQETRGQHPYIKAVQDLARISFHRATHWYLIPDFIFWRSQCGRCYKVAADVVHNHAEKIIVQRRKQLKENFVDKHLSSNPVDGEHISHGKKRHLDFLDILLETKDENGNGLNQKEIRDEVDTFLFEGHDTTASGISWALYNLAKYPELQETCRNEVKSILGDKMIVEWNDLSKFNYLTMFIKESLRLYPPVPIIARQLDNDMILKSSLHKSHKSVASRGSRVQANIFALHRNETTWDKPEMFDPKRFTKENISKRSQYAFLPFAAGSRNCIGQNFAMNEMKTVLAKTLRRYKIYLDEETPAPEIESRLILQNKDGIYVKLQAL